MKYTLTKREIIKGVVLSGFAAALYFVQQNLDAFFVEGSHVVVFEWKKIGMSAVAGAVGYLLKTFFEGEKRVIDTQK